MKMVSLARVPTRTWRMMQPKWDRRKIIRFMVYLAEAAE